MRHLSFLYYRRLISQLHRHPSCHFVQIKGLDNIIIGTCKEVLANEVFVSKSRHHDDWHLTLHTDLLKDLVPILPWKHDIQKDQINAFLLEEPQPFCTRKSLKDLMIFT